MISSIANVPVVAASTTSSLAADPKGVATSQIVRLACLASQPIPKVPESNDFFRAPRVLSRGYRGSILVVRRRQPGAGDCSCFVKQGGTARSAANGGDSAMAAVGIAAKQKCVQSSTDISFRFLSWIHLTLSVCRIIITNM